MKQTLIQMVGLPRSGKSTIVRTLSKDLGAPIVRRDAIRLALHGQRYAAPAEQFVKALSLYMIKSLFLAGHDTVICDETNFSKAARNYNRSPEWDSVFHWVPTSKEICKERAVATGQSDLQPVIEEMAQRWEDFEPTDQVIIHPVESR